MKTGERERGRKGRKVNGRWAEEGAGGSKEIENRIDRRIDM